MTKLAVSAELLKEQVSTTLNSKFMEDKLKIGWGYEDFSSHFGVCEEQFILMMEKTFSNKKTCEYYIGRLKYNEKKRRRNMNRAKKSTKKLRKNVDAKITMEKVCNDDSKKEVEMTEKNEKALEELIREEEEARSIICNLEVEREGFYSERRTAYDKLLKLKEEMIKIQSDLKNKSEEVEMVILELSDITEKVEKANSDIKGYKDVLSEYEEQIKNLKKVTVNISEDSFVIEPEFEIPESWKDIRNSWIDDSRFENLTIAELKQLSQAVVLKEAIEAQDRLCEVSFTSDKVQALFEEITSK